MKSPLHEQFLTKNNARFEYLDAIPLDAFDEQRSLENQARLRRIDEDTVERYAQAMRDGDEFPAVIAYTGPDGFVFISGNHRFQAARKAERPTLDAYIVHTTDPFEIDVLTRGANQVEGLAPSRTEAFEHALYVARRYNRTLSEVARRFGLSHAALASYHQYAEASARLEMGGVPVSTFPRGTVRRLGQVRQRQPMLRLAKLASEAALTETEISDLVVAVNKLDSDQEQLAYLESVAAGPEMRQRIWAKQRGGAAGTRSTRIRRTERARFYRYAEALITLLSMHEGGLEQIQITDREEQAEAMQLVNQLQVQLRKLQRQVAQTNGGSVPATAPVAAAQA